MDLIWDISGIDLFATDHLFSPVIEYVLRGAALGAPLGSEGAMMYSSRTSEGTKYKSHGVRTAINISTIESWLNTGHVVICDSE